MEKDTLSQIRDDFKACSEAEAEQRKASQDDLEFALLSKQWDQADIDARRAEGRPCLTINRMPSFGNQVINDAKMNRASIQVKPLGDGATKHTADIQGDLIRNIETASQAETAYDAALISAVYGGFGYFRVAVDYACDDAWDQDVVIERIANPFSVYGDPHGKEPTSIDWNLAFVADWYSKSAFERRFGKDRKASSFEDGNKDFDAEWFNEERIRVAEYWTRDEVPAKLLKLTNDQVMYESAWLKQQDDGLTMGEFLMSQGINVKGDRMTKTYKVMQQLVTGTDVLEENDWLGKYIPIVPMYGEEVNVNGKRHFISLIRRAKDPQRAFNYWRTASTELVALAPKAPWVGAVGAFATDAAKWATANRVSHQYLEYDPVDGQPPPQRQPFAGVPAGALQEALNASDDMKAAIGMFDASLGARSNETSGKAILARQREGDTSTFHFIDNRNRAVEHGGRIILDLIPHYYTVGRIVRGIQQDSTTYTIPVKQPVALKSDMMRLEQEAQKMRSMPPGIGPPPGPMAMGQQPNQPQDGPPEYVLIPGGMEQRLPPELQQQLKAIVKIFDPTTGKYDVTVSAGPSFTTRREESANQMMEFIRIFPQAAPLIGDLLAKNLDWPGAEQVAERLKAMLPPQVQGQIHPMVQQLQALLQRTDAQAKQAVGVLQKEIDALKKQLLDKQADQELKNKEITVKQFEAATDRYEAETGRLEAEAKAREANINAAAVQLAQVEAPRLQLEQASAVIQGMGATLQAIQAAAQTLQQKPTRKEVRVVRDPTTNQIIGAESVEVPIDQVQGA